MKEGRTVTLQINPIKKQGSDTGGWRERAAWRASIRRPARSWELWTSSSCRHDGLNSHLDALCHYQGPIGRKPGEPAVGYTGFPSP